MLTGRFCRILENIMNLVSTEIGGVYIIEQFAFDDNRGQFIKMFTESFFKENGLDAVFMESFYSVSHKNVIRGMHFQTPPCDHSKIATIISGKVIDVVLDLRKKSETYGKYVAIPMCEKNRRSIYIPKGCAHGFCSLSDSSIIHYQTSTVHSKEHDMGVNWNSFGFKWPVAYPIVSARDMNFPALLEYDSPF